VEQLLVTCTGGLSGILVFVPQIMILFRPDHDPGRYRVYGPDQFSHRQAHAEGRIERKERDADDQRFACAVPAIMSTRNIENRKGTSVNDPDHTPDELQRPAAGLYYSDRAGRSPERSFRLLQPAGAGYDGPLYAGPGHAMIVSYVAKWLSG